MMELRAHAAAAHKLCVSGLQYVSMYTNASIGWVIVLYCERFFVNNIVSYLNHFFINFYHMTASKRPNVFNKLTVRYLLSYDNFSE